MIGGLRGDCRRHPLRWCPVIPTSSDGIHTPGLSPSLHWACRLAWCRSARSETGLQRASFFLLLALSCSLSLILIEASCHCMCCPVEKSCDRQWRGVSGQQSRKNWVFRSITVRNWVLLSVTSVILEANPPLLKALDETAELTDALILGVWEHETELPSQDAPRFLIYRNWEIITSLLFVCFKPLSFRLICYIAT